ncbi:shikimate dehydrogenase [Scatolibacter rhodanostii]|uniref:shikimate dehydrogenase n=1 Tax=Scatolibacter rhodanostii TaxID=2014781 RepID=UPI000C06D24A|nr:shikimate dehydrogenase [Scatolibacter rhodanostii]
MQTQKAAVIGHPIRHTMSPFIHERLFSIAGIPMQYAVLDIDSLPEKINQLKTFDVFNVTIPYKEAIIPFLDELDDKAALFGSVNTVQIIDGKMKGYITDGAGCLGAIESAGINIAGRNLILGNGGTARAIAFETAYTNVNFDIVLAHRKSSEEKAQKIAQEIEAFAARRGTGKGKITCLPYEKLESAGHFDVVINATNVGMYPHLDNSPLTEAVLQNCTAVFDAVFNPEKTFLLKQAEAKGIPTVRGIDMLVRQAVAAHTWWYGTAFEDEQIRKLCEEAAKEMNRIFYNK